MSQINCLSFICQMRQSRSTSSWCNCASAWSRRWVVSFWKAVSYCSWCFAFWIEDAVGGCEARVRMKTLGGQHSMFRILFVPCRLTVEGWNSIEVTASIEKVFSIEFNFQVWHYCLKRSGSPWFLWRNLTYNWLKLQPERLNPTKNSIEPLLNLWDFQRISRCFWDSDMNI